MEILYDIIEHQTDTVVMQFKFTPKMWGTLFSKRCGERGRFRSPLFIQGYSMTGRNDRDHIMLRAVKESVYFEKEPLVGSRQWRSLLRKKGLVARLRRQI